MLIGYLTNQEINLTQKHHQKEFDENFSSTIQQSYIKDGRFTFPTLFILP